MSSRRAGSARTLRLLSLLLALLLLAACSSGSREERVDEGSDSDLSSSAAEDSLNQQTPRELSRNESGLEPDESRYNAALDKVAGLENMDDTVTFGVKNYYSSMQWGEANAIQNLERHAVAEGAYFLIVPRWVGSTVVVETMEFVNGSFQPSGETYRLDSTPDDYALIVNSTMPEAGPRQRVTVTYGDSSGSYSFVPDLSGLDHYPMVQDGAYLVEAVTRGPAGIEQTVTGTVLADVDYGHVGLGDLVSFSAALPATWQPVATAGNDLERFTDGDLTIDIWAYYDLETNYHTVTHFLHRDLYISYTTPGGHTLYRSAFESDARLAYAFELDEGLCVILDIQSRYEGLTSYTDLYDAVGAQFRDTFEVLGKTSTL